MSLCENCMKYHKNYNYTGQYGWCKGLVVNSIPVSSLWGQSSKEGTVVPQKEEDCKGYQDFSNSCMSCSADLEGIEVTGHYCPYCGWGIDGYGYA